MQTVNTNARQIIEKVRAEFGYSFEEMAELCEVATGSVQRWYSTGRAKADSISVLEELISNTRLPEYKIAENLIEIYWHKKRPITITRSQLRDISGRQRLEQSVIEEISKELYERNFAFIDCEDEEGRTSYCLIRKQYLFKKFPPLNNSDLKEYYFKKVELELNQEEDY
jgi:hypothetical protein